MMNSARRSEKLFAMGQPAFLIGSDGFRTPVNQGAMGAVYADMVQSTLANIEQTFADIQINQLIAAATAVWQSKNVFTLGVGINNSNARNFYLSSVNWDGSISLPSRSQAPRPWMI
jgi:DNA-binding MurR/RpiR family transcriptional regulator